MLKFQVKHTTISSTHLSLLTIEFSTFIAFAVTYLTVGLTQHNLWYILVAVLVVLALYIFVPITNRYFESEKVKETVEKALDEELKLMRERFIIKKENEKKSNCFKLTILGIELISSETDEN